MAPLHYHPPHRKRRRWTQIKARAGSRLFSRPGNAAARRAHDSIRWKQASLCDSDGNQTGKEQADDKARMGGCRGGGRKKWTKKRAAVHSREAKTNREDRWP